MKRGDVIGMLTFDVIARGIAEVFVCSLAVFGTKKKRNGATHMSVSQHVQLYCGDTDTLLRQASTSFTCKRIPFKTFFFPSLQ